MDKVVDINPPIEQSSQVDMPEVIANYLDTN
jgi:hypothetical protein